jgi:glycosyltransferase involved in cell wall biosynthesis
VIALPSGLVAAGVPVWGVRLANALAERGRCVAIVLHEPNAGYSGVPLEVHPRVRCVPVGHAGSIESCEGNLSPYLPAYRDAVEWVWQQTCRPVVLSPNLAGDCYGIAAALSLTLADRLRVIGVQHSDIEYEARYLAHYEPLLTTFIGVSSHLARSLAARHPSRARDVVHLPHGVPVEDRTPRREPALNRPLRIAYAGRLDREQKRALSLPLLSCELDRRGIDHELTIVGDGPAARDVDTLLRHAPHALRRGASSGSDVRALYQSSDIMVLPSRYEGLSLSMLEAMAVGCVPVVARVESGACEAIVAGENGEIADVNPEADDADVAAPLADAIERARHRGLEALSASAWRTVRERFSLHCYADQFLQLIDDVADSPARAWACDRPCAFTARVAQASGLVPTDAPERLRSVLQSLAGRTIAIHGGGRHTRALASILADSPASIVAIVDDDAGKHGGNLWGWPIVSPNDLPRLGVTDVVISSAMHEDAILRRSSAYERLGVRVHALYHQPGLCRVAA